MFNPNKELVRTLTELAIMNDLPGDKFVYQDFKLSLSSARSWGLEWEDEQDLMKGLMFRTTGKGSGFLRYSLKSLLRKYHL